jgi:hypothetical protein
MVLDSKFLWIYFWLSGSTLQYFKMRVQQKYISFSQTVGGFSLCFFYKERKYIIQMSFAELIDSINRKSSLKSQSKVAPSSLL